MKRRRRSRETDSPAPQSVSFGLMLPLTRVEWETGSEVGELRNLNAKLVRSSHKLEFFFFLMICYCIDLIHLKCKSDAFI